MRIALVGNQNSGKTTLFNSLTGSNAHTGNFPGVTVEQKVGKLKNQRTKLLALDQEQKKYNKEEFYLNNKDQKLYENIVFIDLPGIYSFSPYTEEEVVSRDYIIDSKPDAVINIIDSTNIERNLYLTLQLLEIDVPVVVALNFADVAKKKHILIDKEQLSKLLGVPVVEISALKRKGIDELVDACIGLRSTKRNGKLLIDLGKLANQYEEVYKLVGLKNNFSSPIYHSIKLLESDAIELDNHKDIKVKVEKIINDNKLEDEYPALIADYRYKYILSILGLFLKSKDRVFEETTSDKADKILTSRLWGIPIFLLIMAAIFHFTFSTNFLFLGSVIPKGSFDIPIIGTDSINSFGVILAESIKYLTDDIIGVSLGNALSTAPAWVSSFFVDGLWAGVSAILSFIPQIVLLFTFISILEDTGYMARICFLFDKLLRKFGLSGKAFLPLLTCFGCSVPAILASKILSTEKEKEVVVRLAPFLSCGAKLPIWGAFAAVLFAGAYVDLIVFSMYIIGIVLAIIISLIMQIMSKNKTRSQFILELPEYRMPQGKSVGLLVWFKTKDYLIRVTTVVAGGLVIIWIFSHISLYPGYLGYVDPTEVIIDGITYNRISEFSILGQFSTYISYIFYPLGFGAGESGWMLVASAFTGIIAKEMVPASLISFVGGDLNGIISTLPYANAAIYTFMIFNLITVPCVAAVSAAKSLLSKKAFWKTMAFWLLFSYFFSAFVYGIGIAITLVWWLSILFGIILILFIVLLFYVEYKKEKKLCTQ
ncbi:MAG: ferrous iron transport protein B [Bacilli bacterium]